MSHFFPSADRVAEARKVLATGSFCELDSLMGVAELDPPYEHDLAALLEEFEGLAAELGLGDGRESGFVVLVPVSVNGIAHTTPVLVDLEYAELAFTSHPEFGAGAIPGEVLVENPRLLANVREELLGVLATWHNTEGFAE